ncbi:hypothetical protein ACFL08_02225 [Patescibacteria group bacterium]
MDDKTNLDNKIKSLSDDKKTPFEPVIRTMQDDLDASEDVAVTKKEIIAEKPKIIMDTKKEPIAEKPKIVIDTKKEPSLEKKAPIIAPGIKKASPPPNIPFESEPEKKPEVKIVKEEMPRVSDRVEIKKDFAMPKPQMERAVPQRSSIEKMEASAPAPIDARRDLKSQLRTMPKPQAGSMQVSDVSDMDKIVEEEAVSKGSVVGKIIGVLVVLLIAAALAGGGYYYFYIYQPSQIVDDSVADEQVPVLEDTGEIVEDAEMVEYVLNMPNYLVVDTESKTKSDLYLKMGSILQELPALEIEVYEFILTNDNYAQIDYDSFADFTGLDLGPQISVNLGNEFSVFLDGGNNRLGMAIAIDASKKDALIKELSANEAYLLKNTQALFMDQFIPSQDKSFEDSSYDDINIRYVNFDQRENTSIDYAIVDEYLVIGTSKQTMRSMVDKITKTGTEEVSDGRTDMFNTSSGDTEEVETTDSAITEE